MKTFTTPDPVQGDPEPFEVEYVQWLTRTVDETEGEGSREERYFERRSATFHRRPDVSGTIVMQVELIGQAGPNGRGNAAILDFIDASLIPEELADWHKLVDDPDVHIHINTISDVAAWLYEVYTGNPSQRP